MVDVSAHVSEPDVAAAPDIEETNGELGEHGLVRCDACARTDSLCRACEHNADRIETVAERSALRLKRINIALELIAIGHDHEAMNVLREVD